ETAFKGIRILPGGRFDTGRPLDTLRALPRVARVLRREKPDYVVIYGWTAWLYVLEWLRRLGSFRLAFVCALDAEIDGGFRRANPVRGFLFERGMRLADCRFAITNHQARLFREKGMSCSLTRLLLAQAEASRPGSKSLELLWVARCHPVKRPHLFLDLAERLPDARCRMICSGQDEALWRAVHSRAQKMQNVEFLETVPYREIQRHFDEAKIFVNTSEHEGVPNTFIHSGLGFTAILSLAVDPDGMFQSFQAGRCARGEFESLVSGAIDLLSDSAKLSAAQEEAARFVSEWHNNDANVNAFLGGLA
ncbi:MAG TPA: glycosyltransferase, partial [Terrimicrobiaceae bacterium]|nr:glycosyltransferase [Terrimicrobiaceae bacterium]